MESRYRELLTACDGWYSFTFSILVNATNMDGSTIREWIISKDKEYLAGVYTYIKNNRNIDTIKKAADCIISLGSGSMGNMSCECELDRILYAKDEILEHTLIGDDLNFKFNMFSNRIISAIRSGEGGLFIITGPEKSGKSRIFANIFENIVKKYGLISTEWNRMINLTQDERREQEFDVMFIDDADDELRVNANNSFLIDIKRRRKKPIIIASCKNISRISDLISYIEPKIFIIPEYTRNEISEIIHNMSFGPYKINFGSCRDLVVRLSNMKIENILKDSIEIINYISHVSPDDMKKKEGRWIIPHESIISAIFACTGKMITIDYDDAYAEIAEKIRKRIIGQEDAIKSILPALANIRTGITDITKPAAVVLAIGPSGTGKTEIGKVIADILYDGKFHKEDMNIYYDKHMISKLIGSPPGYTGSGEISPLLSFVKTNKEGVLILDEIEKCHPSVKDAIMEMLDTGFMNDASGRSYDFRRFFIIMTSNEGFDKEEKKNSIGFSGKREVKSETEILDNIIEKGRFTKSFIGRTHPIIFNHLDHCEIEDIAASMIDDLFSRFSEIGIDIDKIISDDYPDILGKVVNSFEKSSGARSMKRFVENDLKKEILSLIEKRRKLDNNEEGKDFSAQ